MSDLVVALGLVLVIEGLMWALAPNVGMRLLEAAATARPSALRSSGWVAVALGVLLVWIVRG